MSIMGKAVGSLEIIQLAVLTGALGAALLSAVWLIRERGKISAENQSLRLRLADLSATIERSDALLSSRDARIVMWDTNSQKPEIIGSMPVGSGAPMDRGHFLAFGRWLTPLSAGALDRSIGTLRTKGTFFEISCTTITGHQLDVQGRRTGTISFVRFIGLTEIQSENARLKREAIELNEAYSLLSSLAETLPFPMWRRNLSGAVSWSNKAFQNLVLKDVKKLLPTSSGGSLPELFGTQARELMERKRLNDGRFEDQVATVVDGERKVFDVIDVATSSGSAGFARDVSDMDALREEFDRTLRSQSDTLNQLTTAVAIFDTSQKLRSFNSAFQKLWDLDIPFLEGIPTHGLLLDRLRTDGKLPEQPDWKRWREQILGAYRAPEAIEDWWHLPDGRTLRVLANPQPKGGAIWVFENMTEKFDLESRYNTLMKVQGETLDSLAEGVAVFGSDGKVRLSNPAFASLWSLPKELSSEGVHISAIRAACKDSAPNKEWDIFVGSATGFDDARDGRTGQIELNSGLVLAFTQVPLPKGQTMLTFVDITDTVHVARALKDKNEALKRADALKNDFIKHVSYELRSPLTNIIGFTELLQLPSTGVLSERQGDYLDHIATSSTVLLTTVNDILDLASVDAGIMELAISEMDVNAVVTDVTRIFASRFAENNIKLKITNSIEVTSFKADAERVRQILGNLLSNAANYAPDGSTVTLAANRDGNDVLISVHDDGPGMKKDVLDSAFERFVAHANGGRRGGTGLGLSIVKGLVELHRGTVAINSKPGEGTTVVCRFPSDPTQFQVAAE